MRQRKDGSSSFGGLNNVRLEDLADKCGHQELTEQRATNSKVNADGIGILAAMVGET
jgi:hypothetical protein